MLFKYYFSKYKDIPAIYPFCGLAIDLVNYVKMKFDQKHTAS